MTIIAKNRLKADTFRLPVEKIRAGYKSDTYFNRSKYILEQDGRHPQVTMQVFQKVGNAVVCGVDHALAILRVGTGYYRDPKEAGRFFATCRFLEQSYHTVRHMFRNERHTERHEKWAVLRDIQKELFVAEENLNDLWVDCFKDLEIEALYDGETVGAKQPVMLIKGDLSTFAHLETPYLGALTDGTMVATNTRDVVQAANGKQVLMFGARHQAAESQAGSGYAAYIGGASGVSTDEQGEYWGSKGLGTIPHALIAAYGGDTVMATRKFDQYIKPSVVRVSLVDFDNDSVRTSLEVARALGDRLGAVRLDTSENMIDVCFEADKLPNGGYLPVRSVDHHGVVVEHATSKEELSGVNPHLVLKVREALDAEGFSHVGIFVSGGFSAEKIKRFESMKLPVIGYGVGSGLFDRRGGLFEYTADVVEPVAKTGRGLWRGPELHKVNLRELE